MNMFSKGKLFVFISLLSSTVFADPVPHFYIQMENQSDKNASISFQKNVGNVSLQPVLNDHTPLPAKQLSNRYNVFFDPLDSADTFNIVFTGKNDCTFTVGYFAPANPKVSVSGLGCRGGGYRIIDGGYTLLLYVSDIHLKSSF